MTGGGPTFSTLSPPLPPLDISEDARRAAKSPAILIRSASIQPAPVASPFWSPLCFCTKYPSLPTPTNPGTRGRTASLEDILRSTTPIFISGCAPSLHITYMHHRGQSTSPVGHSSSQDRSYPPSMSYYHPTSHPSQGPGSGSRSYGQNISPSNPPPDERYFTQPRGLTEYNTDNSDGRRDFSGSNRAISFGDGYRGHPQQSNIPQGSSFNPHASFASRTWDSSTSYGYSHEPFGSQGGPQYMGYYHNNEGIPPHTSSRAQGTPGRATQGLMSGEREDTSDYSRQRSNTSQSHLSMPHSPMNMTYLPSTHRQPYRDKSPSRSPSNSPTISVTILNNAATIGHTIREIPVPQKEILKYTRPPTQAERASGWRHGYMKCIFDGCTSPAIEPSRVATHLAVHIHARKTHECTCGARFGRVSEANRHLDDQSPCDKCHESRRKHKGTRTCGRCIGSSVHPGV